jgi:hypothetical protein
VRGRREIIADIEVRELWRRINGVWVGSGLKFNMIITLETKV